MTDSGIAVLDLQLRLAQRTRYISVSEKIRALFLTIRLNSPLEIHVSVLKSKQATTPAGIIPPLYHNNPV